MIFFKDYFTFIYIFYIDLYRLTQIEMGNHQGSKGSNQKIVMNLNNQKIILIKELGMWVTIGELEVFPHGLDGLKLWDAGIVLSRYVILNCELFKDKDVL